MAELVKATGLRSVDASLMGSSPIPHILRYSLKARIRGFHPLGRGSIPRIGKTVFDAFSL
uniref:Uncharacterized protein n=1 Tax=viral metagenome TaxID=1070528 RepID=A0A6C0IE16_9ZZZZ